MLIGGPNCDMGIAGETQRLDIRVALRALAYLAHLFTPPPVDISYVSNAAYGRTAALVSSAST